MTIEQIEAMMVRLEADQAWRDHRDREVEELSDAHHTLYRIRLRIQDGRPWAHLVDHLEAGAHLDVVADVLRELRGAS